MKIIAYADDSGYMNAIDVSTLEKLKAAFLSQLNLTHYIKLREKKLNIPKPDFTEEEIHKLPESLKQDARNKLKTYENSIRIAEEQYNTALEIAKEIIEAKTEDDVYNAAENSFDYFEVLLANSGRNRFCNLEDPLETLDEEGKKLLNLE